MSLSFNQLKAVTADFLDARIIPAIPADQTLYRWVLGGSIPLVINKMDTILLKYKPIMKELGILNDSDMIDENMVKSFLGSAFDKEPELKINLFGLKFKFNKQDGEALIDIMKRYSNA